MTNAKRFLATAALIGAAATLTVPAHADPAPGAPKPPISIYDAGLIQSLTDALGLTRPGAGNATAPAPSNNTYPGPESGMNPGGGTLSPMAG